LLAVALARPARAQDAFEIQVYDSETARPGESGLETHANVNAIGVRETSAEGALPTHLVTHLTFEPHIGLCRFCEAGAYFQTAIRPDGRFDYAGVKLRFKVRTPRLARGHVGLALNVEWSSVPREYEPARMAFELRPIADVRWRRLYASVNPIVGFSVFGAGAGVPDFDPAATVLVNVAGPVELGAEYYGAIGSGPASEQVHRLFGVASVVFARWGLQVGAGYGFVAGERVIVKAIVSVAFSGAE
jgi:hypothetical protein